MELSTNLKSCVDNGGMIELRGFSGAPHNPGTIYIAKANDIIAKNKRGRGTCFRSLSPLSFIFPTKYIPSKTKSTIQSDMNMSRSSKPQPLERSATDKNFSDTASTINPSTTFTEFSQLPDFGRVLSHDGKIAKRVNGIDSAKAKPNIPIVGASKLP